MALLRARESVMARFRPLLKMSGVTEHQWRLLRVLSESGPSDATFLSRRCSIPKPSLTVMLRTLAARKLVVCRRHSSDGRRIVVEATPKAVALIEKVAPQANAIYRQLEAEFGRERIETLLDILEDLARGK
jgi:homoprotocatechuate degradation regulator HpaR